MPRRPEEPSRTGYLAPQLQHLTTSVSKIWTTIALGVKWVTLYGSFMLLYLLRPERKEDRSDAGHDRDTGSAASQHSWIITTLSRMPFTKPYSFWVPLLSTTLITVFSFHVLDSHYTPFDNTNDFATACPENDRRTQTSAFVRLFAATVTTMCIHGHLSSLTGSDAWRREFFRMLEVLVNPLASLFAMASAVWYEIAGSLQATRDSWDEKSSIRYRLACMCWIRIDTGQRTDAMGPAPCLMYINPCHISSKLLERDLKWSGRVLFLVILFAQYVQAAVLLSRRIITHADATVDCAMMLMTISGLAALTKSLVVSLINTKWMLASDSFSPCAARACSLQPCRNLKTESNLPDKPVQIVLFGCSISALPRAVLHALAGASLQMLLLTHRAFSLRSVLTLTICIKVFHDVFLLLVICADSCRGLYTKNEEVEPPRNNEADAAPADNTPPKEVTTDDNCSTSTLFKAGVWIFLFFHGLGAIVLGLGIAAFQLVILFGPSVLMYLEIVRETRRWDAWDPSKPCLELWKDSLEDELWWF
ncbi:hypothetical protein GT037_004958 [Alternaria burnsii]|uniref:Uncharacterized protein n=1 Tax=Alternaria burnsii TaxID=1187904 RepID=A0A8H7EEE3_9PLEO|nr:uncharacterized protein GT037_004958 [Alternaria burnsii]KAF7676746.1 hypothetical protein GT037_004958 [Alternaria burnsii]CAI9633579.1 unnamed protein product [Alternaria burnsii]